MMDVALGLAVKVENLLIEARGLSQVAYQQRLIGVISELLHIWPEERIVSWLLKENRGFRHKRPIDLVNSAYATEELLSAVKEMKRRHLKEGGKMRLRRLLRGHSILDVRDLKISSLAAPDTLPVELL